MIIKDKKRIINRASINYLYEISAIPQAVRSNYLNKLLKRRHASNQKNVRLAKIIYGLVDEDRAFEWNPAKICNELRISEPMLRYHKSRFLKDLRKFYFGWDRIEKECFPEKRFVGKEDIEIQFIKAKKMFETGMRKEAKNILLKLDAYFDKKLKENKAVTLKNNYLLITEIYEYLITYYSSQRYLMRFNTYINKLNKVIFALRKDKKINIPHQHRSLINFRLYYALSYKYSYHDIGDYSLRKAYDNIKLAFKEIQNTDFTSQILLSVLSITLFSESLEEKETITWINKGLSLAKQTSRKLEYYTFKAQQNFINFRYDPNKDISYLEKAELYYEKVKTINSHSQYYLPATYRYCQLLNYYKDHSRYKEIEQELIRHQILYPRISIAWGDIYDLKFNEANIFSYSLNNTEKSSKQFLAIEFVNHNNVNKLETLINLTLLRFRDLRFIDFKIKVLTDQLWLELVKGKPYDYEKILTITNKVKRQIRKMHNEGMYSAFNTMCIGFSMIEESSYNSKGKILSKHILRLKELAKDIIKKTSEYDVLTSYSILYTIAQQLNYKEVWDIVKSSFYWIKEYHPEIVEPIIKEIRERENQLHAIGETNAA